jgi:hypothetical protein
VIEELPCADGALLAPLRTSTEFAGVRERLACEEPVDSWTEDDFHFFVFELKTLPEAEETAGLDPPVAVFAMHAESSAVISAVTVEPRAGNEEAEIRDLRAAEVAYTAPYPG